MPRELEFKFRLTPERYALLREAYAPLSETRMETAYFDTPQGLLSRQRKTLRLRLENGVGVVTLKTPLPDGSRGEWETEAPTLAQGLAALKAQGAPVPEAEGLTQICAARFTRLHKLLDIPGGKVELALDRGVLLGPREEAPLLEAELELKAGPDQAAASFARDFARKYSLEAETQSKFARAKALR